MGRRVGRSRARRAVVAARRPFEQALLLGIGVCICAVMLAPLVVTKETVYPFVVGKTLLCRAAIEVAFALWALLALGNPRFRPPRSWLLALLGVGFAWSLVAAMLGASWQRSLWSTYEHMQGVVDSAHWLAFLLVLVSICRELSSLRIFLNVNLGVSVLVAALAIALGLDWRVPFYGDIVERNEGRIGVPLGNAVYLGAYAVMNCLLALAFLAHSLCKGDVADADARPSRRLAARAFWALAAAMNFSVWPLTGATGALLGLLGPLSLLAFVAALLAPWRRRWRLAAAFAPVALAGAGLALLAAGAGEGLGAQYGGLRQVFDTNIEDLSTRNRLTAWRAGVHGFAEQPFTGLGPDHFGIAYAKHATVEPGMEFHVYAHSSLMEAAVTQGGVGLALHVALWAFAFSVLWRSAKRAAPKQRAFSLLAGSALASYFLQTQLQPPSVAVTMQFFLLLAVVVRLETALRDGDGIRAGTGHTSSASSIWRAALRRKPLRLAFVAVALGLSAVGLFVNQSIFGAARAFGLATSGSTTFGESAALFQRAIGTFPALANEPRQHFLHALLNAWPLLRVRNAEMAEQLLSYANAEGTVALVVEPSNWNTHRALASLYRQVALTEQKEYAALAQRHHQQMLALSPRAYVIQNW